MGTIGRAGGGEHVTIGRYSEWATSISDGIAGHIHVVEGSRTGELAARNILKSDGIAGHIFG